MEERRVHAAPTEDLVDEARIQPRLTRDGETLGQRVAERLDDRVVDQLQRVRRPDVAGAQHGSGECLEHGEDPGHISLRAADHHVEVASLRRGRPLRQRRVHVADALCPCSLRQLHRRRGLGGGRIDDDQPLARFLEQ